MSAPRAAAAGDEGYVIATWLRSYLGMRGGRSRRELAARDSKEAIARKLLAAGRVLVVDAPVAAVNSTEIAGWVCYTPLSSTSVVHYVYVRSQYRRRGIARRLLEAAGVDLVAPIPFTLEGPGFKTITAGRKLHRIRHEDIAR